MSQQHSPARAGASKVAIPRLLNKRHYPPPPKNSIVRPNRVLTACLNCRSRKIKCDGATPKCANCLDNPDPCVYASSRKDRLRSSTLQNQDMMALLKELRTQVAVTEQQRIDAMLATVTDDVGDAAATLRTTQGKSIKEPGTTEEQGEANVSAEVGSSVDLDLLDEDLLRNEQTRATGFIGKASEIQWLRHLHSRGPEADRHGPYGPPGANLEAEAQRLIALRQRQGLQTSTLIHTNQASYFLDDDLFELDLEVDPQELPSFEIAEKLLHAFLHSCHGSFPMLMKKTFLHQFYHYYAALRRGQPYAPPQKWQAQLNLVFAIGAIYSHLTSADWQGDERDHLIYHSRAWALALKDPWWFSHPDLPQMQTAGLLSFYYLSIGHINRAWVLIGMALRCGYAMGLHVRNEDRNTDAARKEQLVRVWWGHYALDRYLATITGRPSVGLNRTCSVPLPLPLSSSEMEDTIIESRYGDRITTSTSISAKKQKPSTPASPATADPTGSVYGLASDTANSGSYLKNIVRWGEVTQDALDLYQASTVGESWLSIQNIIAQLTEDLEMWATGLPHGFAFFNKSNLGGNRYERQRNTLEILYHNTRILVTRPCLCRLDRRIKDQTVRSSEFNQRAALACVDSARSIAGLLPDDPEKNLSILYECGPWWNMVHTIMQSLIVLLLELSNGAVQPAKSQEIVTSLKKFVRWLRAMRVNNGMAKRAYSIAMDILHKIVATIPMDIADLLHEDEQAQVTILTDLSPPLEARGKGAAAHSSTLNPYIQSSQPSAGAGGASSHSAQYDRAQYRDYADISTDPMLEVQGGSANPAHSSTNEDTRGSSSYTYKDAYMQSWGDQGSVFPGLFFTNFDEQNPLPGFQVEGIEGSNFEESSRRSPHTD